MKTKVFPPEKSEAYTQKCKSILELANEGYLLHPPSPDFRDGFNLQKRLRKYEVNHLYFLKHPEIDCTNNLSERELRKFKRKQKQTVVLRSDTGA